MHMTEGLRDSTVRHNDRDLMECLGKKSLEVPVILGTPKTGTGVSLNGMIKVRKA
jgi:hypothetical protein